MSTSRFNQLDFAAPPVVRTMQMRSLAVAIALGVACIVGARIEPEQFFRSYLLGFMCWIGVTLGCLGILMLYHLTGGAWGQVICRVLEAGTRNFPLMAVLFVPVVLGVPWLYPWAKPGELAADPHLRHAHQLYLAPRLFLARAAIYFLVWMAMAYFLNRWSQMQDSPQPRDPGGRFRNLSAPGLVIYGFTITFASVDWVMSLDPKLASTIFGLIFLGSQALSAMAFTVVMTAILAKYEPMSRLLKPANLRDHGNLLLTFLMLWAYFVFSQWLLIWSANLPDEINWYITHVHGGWEQVTRLVVLFHFAAWVLLLSRDFKSKRRALGWLAAWLLVIRFFDLFWMIAPNFPGNQAHFHLSWLDVAAPAAIGGLWMALFLRNLNARPLLPLHDPRTRALLVPEKEL